MWVFARVENRSCLMNCGGDFIIKCRVMAGSTMKSKRWITI
jgi:hypothetical protein